MLFRSNVVYKYKLNDERVQTKIWKESKIPDIKEKDFDVEQFVIKSYSTFLFFISKRRSTIYPAPCIISDYGGFLENNTRRFDPVNLIAVHDYGFIHVGVVIRGGGKFGESRQTEDREENNTRSMKDLIFAAETMVRYGYAKRNAIVLRGTSHGGMVALACCNKRPDLFAAVIAECPVTDMLNFHRVTVGKANTSEFLGPSDKSNLRGLLQYSPLQNINRNIGTRNTTEFPSTLVLTDTHDERVPPWHSYKFIAELQLIHGQQNYQKSPLLVYTTAKGGHFNDLPFENKVERGLIILKFLKVALNKNCTA